MYYHLPHTYTSVILFWGVFYLFIYFFGRAPFLDLEKINLGFLMIVIGSKWVCRLHLVTDNSLLLRRGSFVVKNEMIQVPFLLYLEIGHKTS